MNFTRENFLGGDIDFDIDYAKWIFDDDVVYRGSPNADNIAVGGDEADTFIYNSGDGKDIIYGFEEDDMLEITCKFSTPTYNAKTNVIAFKVGSTANAIQLKDFGSTTTFDINGYSYQISGSKLKKQ